MVQGFVRLSVFVNARPGFPNSRGSLADLIQPAGGVGLQKQLVGSVHIAVFCQHIAQKRCGQKARVQVVAVLDDHLVQRCSGGLAFVLTQQGKGNGADILALAVRVDHAILGKRRAVGFYSVGGGVTVAGSIIGLAQCISYFRQQAPGVCQIRRTYALARVHHRLHGGDARLAPFAVVHAVQHGVLGVIAALLLIGRLLCAPQQKAVPTLHHLIVVRQNFAVTRALVHRIRHQNRRIAPPCRHTQHRGHIAGAGVRRGNVRHAPVGVLVQAALCQPFFRHGVAVHQGQAGFNKHTHITGPTCALAGRAVGGNVAEVALLAPDAVLDKLIHRVISAGKRTRHRHVGVDGVGSKHGIGQIGICFDLGIAEAHDREAGLTVVLTLFADHFQHLRRAALLVAVAVLKVFLGKVSVFVQRFAAGQLDLLSGVGGQCHLHITGDILPKVQHGLPVGRLQQLAGEGFVFQNRHGIHTGDEQIIAVGAHTVPARQFAFEPRIVDLALLHIVLTNRPALRCLHRVIGNADRFAVHLQLKQHAQGITEQITVAIHTARAAVPAITESN